MFARTVLAASIALAATAALAQAPNSGDQTSQGLADHPGGGEGQGAQNRGQQHQTADEQGQGQATGRRGHGAGCRRG